MTRDCLQLLRLPTLWTCPLTTSRGRTDNPSGFTPEELEGLRIDAETRALLRDYDRLTPDGRETIREQVDFQLSKSMRDTVPEAVVA